MSDLAQRPGGRVSRRTREQRAFRLVVVSGASGAISVVGFALALFGVIGYGLFLITAIVAVVCMLLFRRAVKR